jgi:hypothetical protein
MRPLLLLTLFLCLTSPAAADTLAVTGDAKIGDDFAFFDFGDGVSTGASTHWPTYVSFVYGVGSIIPAVPYGFGLGYSYAGWEGLSANILIGSVTFLATTNDYGADVPVPITVTGHLVAYHAASSTDAAIGLIGDPLFILDLIGIGFGTLHDQLCYNCPYSYADYTYSGTVTVTPALFANYTRSGTTTALVPTPEPTSFLLLATGTGALGAVPGWRWLRRRRP